MNITPPPGDPAEADHNPACGQLAGRLLCPPMAILPQVKTMLRFSLLLSLCYEWLPFLLLSFNAQISEGFGQRSAPDLPLGLGWGLERHSSPQPTCRMSVTSPFQRVRVRVSKHSSPETISSNTMFAW